MNFKKVEKSVLKYSLLKIMLFIALSFIIIGGMILAQNFILIILFSLFLSIIGVHPILWLDKKKVPHWLSVVLVLLVYILFISGISGIIGGSISSLTQQLGNYEIRFNEIVADINKTLSQHDINISIAGVSQLFDPVKTINFLAGTIEQVGNLMGNIILVFFITFFILFELNGIIVKSKLWRVFTSKKSVSNLERIEKNLRHYLVIKTFVSLLTGALITISLWLIGVQHAILWGLIAFILNYIPNIGSIVAAIPTIGFTMIQLGLGTAFWVFIIYILVNLLVGYFIEPRVMGKGMGLSTLVVLLSLIFWGYVLGIGGMFLSVPLTMTLKIILENNDSTKPFAVLLGPTEEAEKVLLNKK